MVFQYSRATNRENSCSKFRKAGGLDSISSGRSRNHCHVEHYTRSGGNEYFFAYLDDWPDTRLAFEDNGELGPKSEFYAFSVLFVFCPHDGSLELVAKGGPDVHYPLQQAFCKSVFDMQIEPADPLRPAYRLQHVLNPDFTYPTETSDGVARVRLTRIRLATNSNTFPVVAFDLKFRASVTRTQWLDIIHRDIEAHGLRLPAISAATWNRRSC